MPLQPPRPSLCSTTAPAETASCRTTYCVRAVPLHLRDANEFVAQHHRHNLPTVGGKFAVGAADGEGKLVGVAGRPVARRLDDGLTLEVLRVCTDGTPNACSFLYARCAKIARLVGSSRGIGHGSMDWRRCEKKWCR